MTTATATAAALTAAHAGKVMAWVEEYRRMGYQPLPSLPPGPANPEGRKKPMIGYAGHWDTPIEGDPFLKFGYMANVQVMAGARWGLMVIDLDGPEAPARWLEMQRGRPRLPRTWEVSSDGAVKHVWFSLPEGCPPVPSGRLWAEWDALANDGRGDWAKHSAVERLCERKLVMAPPSLHPRTGSMYRWVAGSSPFDRPRPGLAPAWLVAMPVLERPRRAAAPLVRADVARRAGSRTRAGNREILDAIADKVGLARSWGLAFASERENARGWLSCHAAGRADRNPSASFSPSTGRYWDAALGDRTVSLFDLGVLLGAYPDVSDARDHLAGIYLKESAR